MAREKIFFCLPDFSGGGAEKVTLTLLSAFAANKNITCVVLNENGPLRIKLPKICELKNLKCMTAKQGLIPLVQLFRSERPDVISRTEGLIDIVQLRRQSICPIKKKRNEVVYFRFKLLRY